MVGVRCIAPGEARRSIDWQVLVTIAAAFGLGTAMQNSGAGGRPGGGAGDLRPGSDRGPGGHLSARHGVDHAHHQQRRGGAAVPLCVETGPALRVDPLPFLIALVLAASASFMTPIGYQTNMMVYGPGGYRFTDFLRAGVPLNVAVVIAITAMTLVIAWTDAPGPLSSPHGPGSPLDPRSRRGRQG